MQTSLDVDGYIRAAIADSTRDAYESALRSYRDYCHSRVWQPLPVRADRVAEWLAFLAAAGQHKASTIAGYKSALHTYEQEQRSFGAHAVAEMDDPLLKRLLDGIARVKAPVEKRARDAQPPIHPLLYAEVAALHKAYPPGTQGFMRVAAATLCVAAVLRPSELLGSSKHPQRALRMGQLAFFGADGQPFQPHRSAGAPSSLTVTLAISKTDQLMKGVTKHVALEGAVALMWSWFTTRSLITRTGAVFVWEGCPLSTFALSKFVERELESDGSVGRIVGKSFRRGGAASLASQGVSAEDIARSGWAPNSAMWERYCNYPEVKAARARLANAAMEPQQR